MFQLLNRLNNKEKEVKQKIEEEKVKAEEEKEKAIANSQEEEKEDGEGGEEEGEEGEGGEEEGEEDAEEDGTPGAKSKGRTKIWDTRTFPVHPSNLIWAPHWDYNHKLFPARICDPTEAGKLLDMIDFQIKFDSRNHASISIPLYYFLSLYYFHSLAGEAYIASVLDSTYLVEHICGPIKGGIRMWPVEKNNCQYYNVAVTDKWEKKKGRDDPLMQDWQVELTLTLTLTLILILTLTLTLNRTKASYSPLTVLMSL